MKKIFILLLIIPILGFSQYDLVYNKAFDFNLSTGEFSEAVPDGKVWKITALTQGTSSQSVSILNPDGTYGATFWPNPGGTGTPMWLSAGKKILANFTSGVSGIEFNLVTASSSSSGSGGSDTGSNTNNNDDNGFNNSTSPGAYDGSQTNFSSYGDNFTDVEGNTYSTAIIGNLVWTTSNANHSTYRDGTPIPYISNLDEWNSTTTGAYTYLNQDESLGYGKIYNWFAIIGQHDNDQNTENKVFAPTGWRVPTRTNWESIISTFNFGGTSSPIGTWNAFKSTTGWLTYNGNNHSKLNIKPNGFISAWNSTYFGFNDLNVVLGGTLQADLNNEYGSRFWTSTLNWQYPTSTAYSFEIYDTDYYGARYQIGNNYFQVDGGGGYTNSGNYIRLVKDAN